MYAIVGLGNPGKEYENTRHNAGYDALDYISKKYNIDINRIKFKGIVGEGFIEGKKVMLLKPTTYMNLSGESVRELMDFYKLSHEEIIIIYDDISLEVGRLRIRTKGSAGGHNGIKSIISHCGDVFPRIKIGVGQPDKNLVNHVLGKFSKEDRDLMEKSLEAASDAAVSIIKEGIQGAMNKFNSFKAE